MASSLHPSAKTSTYLVRNTSTFMHRGAVGRKCTISRRFTAAPLQRQKPARCLVGVARTLHPSAKHSDTKTSTHLVSASASHSGAAADKCSISWHFTEHRCKGTHVWSGWQALSTHVPAEKTSMQACPTHARLLDQLRLRCKGKHLHNYDGKHSNQVSDAKTSIYMYLEFASALYHGVTAGKCSLSRSFTAAPVQRHTPAGAWSGWQALSIHDRAKMQRRARTLSTPPPGNVEQPQASARSVGTSRRHRCKGTHQVLQVPDGRGGEHSPSTIVPRCKDGHPPLFGFWFASLSSLNKCSISPRFTAAPLQSQNTCRCLVGVASTLHTSARMM